MVAAIAGCSHTTHDWIWLVSCLGFNGPLRLYLVYIGPFLKERVRNEKR